MDHPASDVLETVRRQFDQAPYPRIPLETSPKRDLNALYIHNVVTAFYVRNQTIVDPQTTVILDAGCGTGYTSLALAEANPGAKIVGIDLSPESVKLAKQRLDYYGFNQVEFHALSIEELPSLNLQFDYINADEVLYLLPDPIAGLQAMRSVLKPHGIIRTNFHSSLQRAVYFRAQEFFRSVGLMQGGAVESDVELVRQTMRALKNTVSMKATAWAPHFETDEQRVLANQLLEGDKGWTLPEFFAALRSANLEFISMVNWWQWDLLELFANLDELPISIGFELADKSLEEQLHLFELLHPVHRLLDLWCGHPNQSVPHIPVADWMIDHWQAAKVSLHPQLQTPNLQEDLITCVGQLKMFEISQYLRFTDGPVTIDSFMAACLLPLLEGPQPFPALVQRYKTLRPVHPVTLAPTEDAEAIELVKQLLIQLQNLGYLLLECPT